MHKLSQANNNNLSNATANNFLCRISATISTTNCPPLSEQHTHTHTQTLLIAQIADYKCNFWNALNRHMPTELFAI